MRSLKLAICAVIGVAVISAGIGAVDVQAAGESTAPSVIEISTAEEFNKLNGEYAKTKYADATFVLTADINAPDAIKPIDKFTGTFDGNGYQIAVNYNSSYFKNSYIWGVYYLGLFKNLTGTIKNLSVKSVATLDIDSKSNVGLSALYVGGIVGLCDGGSVINCHSDAKTLSSKVPFSLVYVGGIVGCARGTSTVSGCFFDGIIDYTNLYGTPAGVACVGWGENASDMTFSDNYYISENVSGASKTDATAITANGALTSYDAFKKAVNDSNKYWLYVNDKLTCYDKISTAGVSVTEIATSEEAQTEIQLPEITHPNKNFVGWEVKCNGTGVCKFYKPGEVIAADADDTVTGVFANFKMSETTYIRTTAVDGLKVEGKVDRADFDKYRNLVNANCGVVGETKIGIKLKMIVFLKDAIKTNAAGDAIVDGMNMTEEDFNGKKYVEVECDEYIGEGDDSGIATVGVTIVGLKENHYDSQYGYMFFLEATYNTLNDGAITQNYYCPVRLGCASAVADEAIKSYYDAVSGNIVCDDNLITVVDKGEEKTTTVNILAKYAKIKLSSNAQSRLDAIINRV